MLDAKVKVSFQCLEIILATFTIQLGKTHLDVLSKNNYLSIEMDQASLYITLFQ